MRIAAIGAHPDDIEIFMGGSLLCWQQMGAELHFITATDGAKGGTLPPEEMAAKRAAEAEESASFFGARLHLLGFPDGALISDHGLQMALTNVLHRVGPDLVITHAGHDYHGDHRTLSQAVRQAVGFRYPVLYCDTFMGTGFLPTHYVDITSQFVDKCKAIRFHQTQDPDRFVEMCRLQNGFRAAQCGQSTGSFAEAYHFDPVYPFADIRNLLPPAPGVRPIPFRGAEQGT